MYFKVVSNTDDFPNNNESDFRVNPYGGVQFDERLYLLIVILLSPTPYSTNESILMMIITLITRVGVAYLGD